MLSKEELLMRVQQGMPEPTWTVVRPKSSYLLQQVAAWAVMTLVIIGSALYIISTPNFAVVFSGASVDTDTALQGWRTFDFVALGVLGVGFLAALVVTTLDLLSIGRQLLVITPEGFFVALRNKEYVVAYANAANIVANFQRGGSVKLHVRTNTGALIINLDKRFGQPKALASQIVSAQRQRAAAAKA